MEQHTFGWKKDKRDERDYIHKAAAEPLKAIPAEYSLEDFLASVRNQGRKGSCTGFGIGGALTGAAKLLGIYTEWFSPEWIYNGGRYMAGDLPHDVGCFPRDNYDFLHKHGCLLEHYRPYHETLDPTSPLDWTYESKPCSEYAALYPLFSYWRITGGALSICDAIAEGRFVTLGSPWFDSWCTIGSDGVLPAVYGRTAGGHETFLYGYDLISKVFFGQNSWGKDWGKGGRFTMPFSAIDAFLVEDGYDAHYFDVEWTDVEPEPVPTPRKRFPWWILAVVGAATAIGLGVKSCNG